MKNRVLVIHYNRGVFPLRSTIKDHLLSFGRYSDFDCTYVNIAFGFPEGVIGSSKFSHVIFHTSFLGMRWSRELFGRRTKAVRRYLQSQSDACPVIVAIPQDEFINTDLLDEFLASVKTSYILTCAGSSEWSKIYPKSCEVGVKFQTVLTGYLDEETIKRVSRFSQCEERDIDVGYRAWRAHPSLGSWGRHKVEIASKFSTALSGKGLTADISLDDKDTFLGDDWFRFLSKCKATIGVTGGASILDADGTIKRDVDRYLLMHPNADYAEIYERFLSDAEGTLNLSCISPRHLEACLTKTVQFLVEADYSGLLVPNLHYFPIKEDYSNIDQALDFLSDEERMNEMAARSFEYVLGNHDITYRGFISKVDALLTVPNDVGHDKTVFTSACVFVLKTWDLICWKLVQAECYLLKQPKNSILYRMYAVSYGVLRKIIR